MIAAALDSLFPWADEILLESRTIRHVGPATVTGASAEVVKDFMAASIESAPPPLPLPTRARARVFTDPERERLHARARTIEDGQPMVILEDALGLLRREHPRAAFFVAFTRVGFDASQAEALLYVTIHCGGLCGAGNYVHLRRSGSRWVVQRVVQAWIS